MGNKRQELTACAYCCIVVEYCSKNAMWCKMQRGFKQLLSMPNL